MKSKQTDRQLVNIWLDEIGEHDPACREEVIEACKTPDGRAYYVTQAKSNTKIVIDKIKLL